MFLLASAGLELFSQDAKLLNPEVYDTKPFTKEGFILDYASFTATGIEATGNKLPFWMYRNTNGRIDPETNIAGLFQGSISYYLSEKSYFEFGAGAIASNGNRNALRRDELYLSFVNSWLKVTLGSKNPYKRYQGLSVVDKDFIISGNARSLPGLIIEAPEPLKLSNTFCLDWAIAHYELNDDRFVSKTRVHHKRLGLVVTLNERNQLYGGIVHYAQWAGNSPEFGRLPSSFTDFIEVFFARGAADNSVIGEGQNSLGNHIGLYHLEYNFSRSSGLFSIYHQHPFEDGSGSALKNFPDGIWGFYFRPNKAHADGFVNGVLLEYVQTTNQSRRDRPDNYFANGIYQSGWTYRNNTIGLPVIVQIGGDSIGFYNRTRAINVGLTARGGHWSFRTKTSFVQNLGSYRVPLAQEEFAVYSYLNTTYSLETYGDVSLILGFDYSDQNNDTFGAGLEYKYSF